MKGGIGCPAKRRLEVLEWHYKKSSRYSSSGKPEVTLTCRHFGIHRSQFYRWKNRYNSKRLTSLEPGSTTPKKKRPPEYPRDLVLNWEALTENAAILLGSCLASL
jgi:transposase-like protein